MKTSTTGTFEIKSWDEKPFAESDAGTKTTLASVTKRYAGGLEGKGTIDYVMAYRPDGTADFVGMEMVEGRLDGRPGTFVLQHGGVFEDGVAKIMMTVVRGSGTGELRGLRGSAAISVGHDQTYAMALEYDFESET
jgi:uncharacterized protein DUF3224